MGKIIGEGITFDDVLLVPAYSEVIPNQVDLSTNLTKKMAEDLTEYLEGCKIKVRYMHYDIDTIERMEIIRDLRLGEFDVLVGINLLREGLDIPEVSLVAILDADKEGFLRSETSLIQTVGRAARNAEGKVILYADVMTRSIKAALYETERRRRIQKQYNEEHGITPQRVRNSIHQELEITKKVEETAPTPLTEEEKEAIARQKLGEEKRPMGEKTPFPAEDMAVLQQDVTAKMDIAMPMFNLGFKCEPTGTGEAAIRQEIIGDLAAEALFGESSELYLKLYEEGLIDSSFGGGFETIDGCAMLMCSGDSDEPEAVRSALLQQAEKIAAEGIEEEAFLRMKRSALGRRIRSLDSFDATCFRVCAYHFSDFDYFRFPEVYRSIEAEEICSFLSRVVREERCSLSVIHPLS